jgi:hypothetical protein
MSNANDGSTVGPLPDLGSVVALTGDDPPRQTEEFRDIHERACKYLLSHSWAAAIEQEYLGGGIDGILFIFLFKIQPARVGVDSWVWVIVGDIPSAYITCDECKTPYEALDGYIGEMEQWVEAVRAGKSVAELIPVNVPPTAKYAEMLSQRLDFLEENILPYLEGADPSSHGE